MGSAWLNNRATQNVMALVRLRPGSVRSQVEAHMRTKVAELSAEHPRNGALSVRLTKPGMLGDSLGAPARAFAWGIFGLGVLLMLAGCSNLAGLLLARGNDRTREIVLRTAVGAGRMRIVRQLFTESILLALSGGLAGAAIAWLATRAASAWRLPVELPAQIDLTADATVLLFAIGASVAVGILVGLAPARFAVRLDLNQSLKGHADPAIRTRRLQGREVLVAIQVALCVVLLHASFLSMRGLQRASTASLGWNPDNLVTAATELGLAGYPRAQFESYMDRVIEETMRLPGVESVSLSNSMPLHIDQSNTTIYALPITDPETVRGASFYSVSPRFFGNLQIPLKAGRDFTAFDGPNAPQVAIINTFLAERLFPGVDAIGRQVRNGRGGPPITVVGIADNGKYVAIGETPRGAIFWPLAQHYNPSSMLIARPSPGSAVPPHDLQRVIQGIDPNLPIRSHATGARLTALPLLPYRARDRFGNAWTDCERVAAIRPARDARVCGRPPQPRNRYPHGARRESIDRDPDGGHARGDDSRNRRSHWRAVVGGHRSVDLFDGAWSVAAGSVPARGDRRAARIDRDHLLRRPDPPFSQRRSRRRASD